MLTFSAAREKTQNPQISHTKQYIIQKDEGEPRPAMVITQRTVEQEQMETDESELPFVITEADTVTGWRTETTQRCIQMPRLPFEMWPLQAERNRFPPPFYSHNVILLQRRAKGPSLSLSPHLNFWEGKQVWTPFSNSLSSRSLSACNSAGVCVKEGPNDDGLFIPPHVWSFTTALKPFTFSSAEGGGRAGARY